MVAPVTRSQVLSFRTRAQQLDRAAGSLTDTGILGLGVQDTGPDGAGWALSIRGVDVSAVYLRFCRPCNATHLYEMPFRLAALRAGLELEADTSPPVLRRIPGFRQAASDKLSERYDVVRAYLRLLGPATPRHVAAYLDSAVKDVKARWPSVGARPSGDNGAGRTAGGIPAGGPVRRRRQ